jgi:hypothetical protein
MQKQGLHMGVVALDPGDGLAGLQSLLIKPTVSVASTAGLFRGTRRAFVC